MKPLALAFGVLILGDDLFVQIPEQAGFAFKAGRGRDKPNRVFTGGNRGQFFPEPAARFARIAPEFIP